MDAFMYYNPTKLLFGKGQIDRLPKEIKPYGTKILLVYGGGSIKRNGVYGEVTNLLKENYMEWVELPGVEPNPRLTTVQKGIDLCKEHNIDFVLAVGGGSVIDCTKAIVVGAKTDENVWDILSRKVRATDGLPYGSIVTIAGTGAELSLNAVITKWEEQDKRAWVSSFSRAKFAIVDPAYTKSVPKQQTVYGIVDTMSHLLEHYFHRATNTPIQDQFLESVLRTVIDVTPKLLEDLENEAYRETIAFASTIALSDQLNMGFIGDWGTHHIDHALSAFYDIPHGGGMAILFPNWMNHVLCDKNKDRFKQLAVQVLEVNPDNKTDMEIAKEGIHRLSEVWTSWGAPNRLADYNIPAEEINEVAKKTIDIVPNCGNYAPLSEEDIVQILQASM